MSRGGTTGHAQIIKMGFGADGTYSGDVSPSNPFPVADDVRATGGATAHHVVSAASDNATLVKSSAGTVYGVTVYSIDATPVYVKLYNKATAPNVGTDTPILVIGVGGTATIPAPIHIPFPKGIAFGTGIGFGIVTGITDASTAAVSASEVILNIQYK